jgi:hypothetical protein
VKGKNAQKNTSEIAGPIIEFFWLMKGEKKGTERKYHIQSESLSITSGKIA